MEDLKGPSSASGKGRGGRLGGSAPSRTKQSPGGAQKAVKPSVKTPRSPHSVSRSSDTSKALKSLEDLIKVFENVEVDGEGPNDLYTYRQLRKIRKELLEAEPSEGGTKKVPPSREGSRSSVPTKVGTKQGGNAGLLRPPKGEGRRANLRTKVKQARRELKKLLEAEEPDQDQVLKAFMAFRTKVSNLISTREVEPDKDNVKESYQGLQAAVEKLLPGSVGKDTWDAVKSGEAFISV